MTKALAGQTGIVTGASRGIGAATAKALAAQGMHVVLVARTAAGLEEVEDAIHTAGGTATIAPLDMADGDSIARLAEAIVGRWDRIEALILNAATLGTLSPIAAIDGKEMNRLFTLNVLAQQAMLAAFDGLLRRAERAHVVALTSSVATAPRAYWGAYAASKAALENLVLTYGEELKNISGVRSVIVDPGATRTTMRARAYPGEDPSQLKEPEVVADAIAQLIIDGAEPGQRLTIGR